MDGERSRPGEDESPPVDVGTALRFLANPQCRFALRRLASDSANTANVDDLVDSYAEHTGRPRESIEIECHHTLLPLLDGSGVIDFDESTGDVRYYRDPFLEELLAVIGRWEEQSGNR